MGFSVPLAFRGLGTKFKDLAQRTTCLTRVRVFRQFFWLWAVAARLMAQHQSPKADHATVLWRHVDVSNVVVSLYASSAWGSFFLYESDKIKDIQSCTFTYDMRILVALNGDQKYYWRLNSSLFEMSIFCIESPLGAPLLMNTYSTRASKIDTHARQTRRLISALIKGQSGQTYQR